MSLNVWHFLVRFTVRIFLSRPCFKWTVSSPNLLDFPDPIIRQCLNVVESWVGSAVVNVACAARKQPNQSPKGQPQREIYNSMMPSSVILSAIVSAFSGNRSLPQS